MIPGNVEPKLTFIVPTVNDLGAVRGLIQALAADQAADIECVFVGESAVLARASEIASSAGMGVRTLVAAPSDGFAVRARRALDAARGEYVAFLDANDRPAAGFVRTATDVLREEPSLGFVYGDRVIFGAIHTRIPSVEFDRRRMTHANLIPTHAVFRRELYEKAAGFSFDRIEVALWEFFVRIIAKGYGARRRADMVVKTVLDQAPISPNTAADVRERAALVRSYPGFHGPIETAWAVAIDGAADLGRGDSGMARAGVVPTLPSEACARGDSRRLGVVWEGSQFITHSLALVNRELGLRVAGAGHELSIVRYEDHTFGADADPRFRTLAERMDRKPVGAVDVHVRHQWPPRLDAPEEGRWVVIQPWEWGAVPKAWIAPFSADVDEVWVPSRFVRSCYLRAGIPAERVHVVPNGTDTKVFRPEGDRYPLRTKKRTKFLFVGGTIRRKGIDVLLDAWSRAFTAADDVCLVIKDLGSKSFYRGQTAESAIAEYSQRKDIAEIEYIDESFDDRMMAALYRSVDVFVHPYRGEGFGLPILEAMASGLPVIVTDYGPAPEFVGRDCGLFIPATEVRNGKRAVGDLETTEPIWLAEPEKGVLVDHLRALARDRSRAVEMGRRGRAQALNYDWDRIGAAVEQRLQALAARPVRRHRTSPGDGPAEPPRDRDALYLAELESAMKVLLSGDDRRADDAFARMIGERPEVAAAYIGRARVAERAERHREAVEYYETAIGLLPEESSFRIAAADLERKIGRPEAAEIRLLDALDRDPSSVDALLRLAEMTGSAGRHDEAAHFVTRALRIEPARADVLVAYAEFCLSLGYAEGAASAVSKLRATDCAPETIESLERRTLSV